ncbi:hypothetical protein [Morganella phage Mecenats66]|nr:hypothetical protein [Morganella phage Mecenats66]
MARFIVSLKNMADFRQRILRDTGLTIDDHRLDDAMRRARGDFPLTIAFISASYFESAAILNDKFPEFSGNLRQRAGVYDDWLENNAPDTQRF